MKKKIFIAMLLLLFSSLLVFSALGGIALSKEFEIQTQEALSSIRVTILTEDGQVSFDNLYDKDKLDNHLDREEVQEAMENGWGRSQRYSDTSERTTYYYAIQLKDNQILRMSLKVDNLSDILHRFIPLMGLSFFITLSFALILSSILTDRIVKPINLMDLDSLEINEYKELTPFVERIQAQKIEKDLSEIHRKEFSANVSHELKTPLTIIKGYSELISSGSVQEKDLIPFAEKIHYQASRLQNIIGDIISLSEFDEDKKPMDIKKVRLYQLAEGVLESLEERAKEKEVTLTIMGKTDLEAMGNEHLLESMIYNLLDNGIKYNKKGGKVNLILTEEGDYIKLVVADTGIGIPKEHREHIFERFYLIDKSRSKKTGGTGLGLSIVKHIAEYHSGYVDLQSQEGVGTSFICYIRK